MACATGVVKFVVFLFNLLCSIVGLALIVLGYLSYVAINRYTDVVEDHFSTPVAFVIAVGVIVFLISFVGCCGVVRNSNCMLITYAVILILLSIVHLAAGIYAVVKVKDLTDVKNEVEKGLMQQFIHYSNQSDIRDTFDVLQNGLNCCGIHGYSDYNEIDVPKSCCRTEDCSGPQQYWEKGCSDELTDWLIKTIQGIGYVAIGIAATELICAMLALCLSSSIRNEYRRNLRQGKKED